MDESGEQQAMSQTTSGLFRLLIVFYLLGVHVIAGLTLWRSEAFSSVRRSLPGPKLEEVRPAHYKMMRHFHQIIDGNVGNDSVLFFGDSLTQGLLCTRVDGLAVNFGIGTDDSAGGLERIRLHQSVTRANLVVLAFGINDLSKGHSIREIVGNFSSMVELFPKETVVLINAVFPIDEIKFSGVLNAEILELNKALKTFCVAQDQIHFCDPTILMRDIDGNLKDEFHVGDGLHLNSSGNEIWIAELRALIERFRLVDESSQSLDSEKSPATARQ